MKEAIRYIKPLLQADSNRTDLLTLLADNFYEMGQPKEAEEVYAKAYTLDSSNEQLSRKWASLLIKTRQYKKAISVCEASLQKQPQHPVF